MALVDKESLLDRHYKDVLPPTPKDALPGDGPYFRSEGTSNSPFVQGDQMVQLLTSALTTTTGNEYIPSNLDIDGAKPTLFNQGPEPYTSPNKIDTIHEQSFQKGGTSLSLGGENPNSFDNGPESFTQPNAIDTLHESSLTNDYTYQHGNSLSTAPASQLDLNGNNGNSFDNGIESFTQPNTIDTLHENSLTNDYTYQHGNSSGISTSTLLSRGDIAFDNQYINSFNSNG
tara:strand:- start:106 stop:795 length:690 start_codon:yes stop_codon:yes gene_type:complete